ncbi:MAG: CvpA family protein [Candidatus Omnitrophota bacterium]
MVLYILKNFNWLDVFVFIVLFRISYIAIKSGFAVELFKFLGVLCAVYLSLHYYVLLSDFIGDRFNLKNAPKEYLISFIFTILAIFGYWVFIILRKILARFVLLEPLPSLNKWGGFILGIARFILYISLIMYLFIISPVGYLRHSVNSSFSSRYLLKAAPVTYSGLWKGIISKFIPQEKFNQDVLRVTDEQKAKK